MRKVNLPNEFGLLVTKPWVGHATFLWWHGLSQPTLFWTAFIDFRRPLENDGFWATVDVFWTAY